MWQAFVTGFAKKSTELIDERNKEIRDEILMQMNQLAKEKQEVKQREELRTEKLKRTTRELTTILGDTLGDNTKPFITELLASGEADTIIKKIRDNEISVDQITRFVTLDPNAPTRTPEEFIAAGAARPKAGGIPIKTDQMTGAFGLPTRAGSQAVKYGAARFGLTEAETAGVELPELPPATAKFDYEVFRGERKPQDVVTLEAKMTDKAVAQGMSIEEFRATDAGMVLQAQIDGRNFLAAQRKGSEEEKFRSTAQIGRNINAILTEKYKPLELNGIIQFQPGQTEGDPGTWRVLIPNHPDAKKFQQERLQIVRNYFEETKLVDKQGNIKGGIKTADAIRPYAEVDFENFKVKRWLASPLEGQAPTVPEAAKPAAGKATEPSLPRQSMEPPAAAPKAAAAPTANDRQQSIDNARLAAKRIENNATLSMGQKNGKISEIRKRLRDAGIDPKEAGL